MAKETLESHLLQCNVHARSERTVSAFLEAFAMQRHGVNHRSDREGEEQQGDKELQQDEDSSLGKNCADGRVPRDELPNASRRGARCSANRLLACCFVVKALRQHDHDLIDMVLL